MALQQNGSAEDGQPAPTGVDGPPATSFSANPLPVESTGHATPQPAGFRSPGLLIVYALIAAMILLPWIKRRWIAIGTLPPPAVNLTGVDSLVAQAIIESRAVVESHRRSPQSWGRLAQVLRAHEFDQEADLCFERAAELDPDDPRWPYLIACGPRCTDPQVALPFLQRAAEHCHGTEVPRLALGELLDDLGRLDEAESQFAAVLRSDPGNARAHCGLGHVASQRGQLQKAEDHLRRAAAAAPDVKLIHALLAEVLGRLDDQPAAQAERLRVASAQDRGIWPDPYRQEVASRRVGLKGRLTRAQNLQAQGQMP